MPKLSAQCMNDVKRYIYLRFDHLGETWIKARIQRVVRALKKESKEVQEAYSEKVDAFFEINNDVICDAARAKAQFADPVISTLLNMDEKKVLELVHRHGGNVNAAMDSLNGNNNKQH